VKVEIKKELKQKGKITKKKTIKNGDQLAMQ